MTSGNTIVLVDDDEDVLAFLREVLCGQGFDVECFSDGRRALEFCEGKAPALVISDVLMPELNGLDFQELYQRRFPHRGTPFVFLSSLTDAETHVAGLEGGADDFLVKPVDPSILSAKVRALLRRRRRTQGTSFRGDLAQLPLPNLLRFCEVNGLTGYVDVFLGDTVTSLRFRAGQIAEADLDECLSRLSDVASAPFVVHSCPLDFDELDGSSSPPPSGPSGPVGRISGIRLKKKLFQIQTEVAGDAPLFIVTVVSIDGRSVWKRRTAAPDDASQESLQQLIDAQHTEIEQMVDERMSEELAKARPPRGDTRARFHQLYDEGYDRFRAGDFEGAIGCWREALAIDPTSHALEVNIKIANEKLSPPAAS